MAIHVKLDPALVATPFFGALASRVLDQNSPHRFGCCREKMPDRIPLGLKLWGNHSQIDLVYQRRRLQRLARAFVVQSSRGQLAEFVVHQGKQLFAGSAIPLLNRLKDFRDRVHRSLLSPRELKSSD
jgi:hypothetical protein